MFTSFSDTSQDEKENSPKRVWNQQFSRGLKRFLTEWLTWKKLRLAKRQPI